MVLGCIGDAEVGTTFPSKMGQGGKMGWIRKVKVLWYQLLVSNR